MAATESERELRSKSMMMDMVKEIAKIFKGNNSITVYLPLNKTLHNTVLKQIKRNIYFNGEEV